MIKPGEINLISKKYQISELQIEKDYIISWILFGISANPFLKKNLAFKGGTLLKKVYFPAFRFSDNLSFTFLGEFNQEEVKSAFKELAIQVQNTSAITLVLKESPQQEADTLNLFISFIGTVGGSSANNIIKIDVAKKEVICNPPEEKNIVNVYSDLQNEKVSLLCYPLNEIIPEKMRSLMLRTTARDIYDLWYLFEMDGNDINDHIFDFQEKAKFKNLDPKKLVDVVEKKGTSFAIHWRDYLTPQMVGVPDFGETFRKLVKSWKKFQRFNESS